MRRTLLKRIGAVALAVAVSLTMGVTSFAATTTDGTVNEDKGIDSTENTISIAKQIVFVNHESTTVREPNITYTYTIATTTPGSDAKITDKNSTVGTVKAGPIGAVSSTTATVTFADTKTSAASANGTSTASKYADFTFTPATFGVAGIYRYKISETCSPTKASVGITEAATYAADRYLDVYVKWSDDAHTTLAIYGYVLFEGSETQAIKSAKLDGGDVSMKSKGYVNTASSGQEDVDVYTTENLYINKATVGALADKTNDFPISLTLTAPTGVSNVKMDVTTSGNGYLTTSSDTVGNHVPAWGAVTGTVRNDSQIVIKGIPAGATASIVETNNTGETYKVKAGTTAGGTDLLSEASVAGGADATATSAVTLNAKSEIDFTNTLNEISPTNVVMRFAPFLFIFGAAILLLVVMRRRKAQDTE